MMNAALKKSGMAPPTARSLTVPWTASEPMSPPRKKQRLHDKRVGGEGEARPTCVNLRLVILTVERGIREERLKQSTHQVGGKASAAAVPEHDAVLHRQRRGASDDAGHQAISTSCRL